MYEDYYRFNRQPFSLTPDPEFLYKSASHQDALEQLLRGIRRREGFLLLTGDIGTGKTTICRALVQLLGPKVFTAVVLNPFVTEDELLRVLLQDFGVVSRGSLEPMRRAEARSISEQGWDPARAEKSVRRGRLASASRQELVETLNDFLLSLAQIDASAVVIIDEAQHLAPRVLEQLRILTNLETDQQKLLQVLLIGQLELAALVASPEMRQLDQRIARRPVLKPLTRKEVEQYVAYRLRIARGAWGVVFTDNALELIYELSGGIPRKINLICDRALEAGYLALTPQINEDLIVKAAESLQLRQSDAAVWKTLDATERRWSPEALRWATAAAGIVTGVGLGVATFLLVPRWLEPGRPPPPSPPPALATFPMPEPVDFLNAVMRSGLPDPSNADTVYIIRVASFADPAAAEATTAVLNELGYRSFIVRPERQSSPHLVMVGPFTTIEAARLVESDLERRLRFRDARILADVALPQSQ